MPTTIHGVEFFIFRVSPGWVDPENREPKAVEALSPLEIVAVTPSAPHQPTLISRLSCPSA